MKALYRISQAIAWAFIAIICTQAAQEEMYAVRSIERTKGD